MKKRKNFILFVLLILSISLPIHAFYKENLDSLYSEALNGNARAAGKLGYHYYHSKNNDTNRNLAFKFLSMAVAGGYDSYLPELGICYYKGIGTEVDYKRAFDSFNKALNHTYDKAQCLYYLGECYNNGHGVKKNTDKAVNLFNQCIETEYEGSESNLYKSLAELRLSELDKDNEYEHVWRAMLLNESNVEAVRRYLHLERYSCFEPAPLKKEAFPQNGLTLSPEENSQKNFSDMIISNILYRYDNNNSIDFDYIVDDDENLYSDEAAGEIYLGNALLHDRSYTPYDIDEKTLQIEKNNETSRYNFILNRLAKAAYLGNKEAFYHMGKIKTYHIGDLETGRAAFVTALKNGSKDGAYELAKGLMIGIGGKKDENTALSILNQLSDTGHAQSIYELALFALQMKEPFQVVKTLLLSSGDKGFSQAYYNLGYLYKHGKLHHVDKWKTESGIMQKDRVFVINAEGTKEERDSLYLKYMTMAADMGNSDALWQLYLNTEDKETSRKYLEEAAKLGNTKALNALANRHYNNKEYERAIELWSNSAALGYALGIYNLGILKKNGEGCEQNLADAMEYFKYASELNYGRAHLMLAKYHESGTVVEKDLNTAEEYYKKYANLNWEGWYKLAEFCYNQGSEDGYKKALTYYETAIKEINIFDKEGNIIASIKNAKAEENPHFIPSDINKDILGKIYYNLSNCYSLGRGVERNEEKAAEYLKKSTALGNSDAKKIEEFFSSVR